MTPTEQDKELHSKSYKLAQEYLSADDLEGFVDLIQNNLTLDEALQLITADRKLVALEARVDELNRMLEHSEGQLIMRELLLDDDSGTYYYGDTISRDDRIAELKAQQEEK